MRLFKAVYLLAYFGMLRVSELVFTNSMYAQRPFFSNDIYLGHDSKALFVTIRFSKTNQLGNPTTLRIPASNDSNFCCVTAVKNFLQFRPTSATYFFCHEDSAPLTRSQFSGVLAKAISHAGLPSRNFRTHSFRIGRATTLAAQGMSTETIKQLGRWKSNSVQTYIRLT